MEADDRENSTEHASTDRMRLRLVRRIFSTSAGATLAAALLTVLGGWLWHLGVRDARQVPIISASNQPVKIRPADPGGEVTPYQDIGSYDIGVETIEESSEIRLAPPPPEPAAEDTAMADLKEPESEPEPESQEPESGPAQETEASIALPPARPSRPESNSEASSGQSEEAEDDSPSNASAPGTQERPTPAPPPPRPDSLSSANPRPRPDNLRIRTLVTRANAEDGDQE